jgi:hypothetical protein
LPSGIGEADAAADQGVYRRSSSSAGGVAENVGGRDIRTLFRRAGAVVLLEFVDCETSLPFTFAFFAALPFAFALLGADFGGGAGGSGVTKVWTGVLLTSSFSSNISCPVS